MRHLRIVLVGLVLLCAPNVYAQSYPAKPIRIVVPFAPGGPTDILGRMVAQLLTEGLDQQVVVENRAGAGGTIGTDAVAKSAGDGYTLLMGTNSPLAINAALVKLPYDPLSDLTPIVYVGSAPLVLVVHPSLPAKSVSELISLLKAKPEGYSFASSGNGTPQHLSGELFKTLAGVSLVHIPYKGSGPLITDLLGGQVQMSFDSILPLLPHIRAGKLRALAQTRSVRSSLLPDTPTMLEAGLAGFETYGWFGVVAPANTPKPIVDRLNAVIARGLSAPQAQQRLAELGVDPAPASSPVEFGRFMKSEIDKWAKIVKASGAKAD